VIELARIIVFWPVKILEYLSKKNVLYMNSWGKTESNGYKSITMSQKNGFVFGKMRNFSGAKIRTYPVSIIDEIAKIASIMKMSRGIGEIFQ